MSRVVAQGDLRPFSGRTQGRSAALDEIRRLLAERERLYARAPLALDTSGKTVRQTLQELRKGLP
jgi:XRE family aerobic/anaerobic benzoate catabolism transcriptional regulator